MDQDVGWRLALSCWRCVVPETSTAYPNCFVRCKGTTRWAKYWRRRVRLGRGTGMEKNRRDWCGKRLYALARIV